MVTNYHLSYGDYFIFLFHYMKIVFFFFFIKSCQQTDRSRARQINGDDYTTHLATSKMPWGFIAHCMVVFCQISVEAVRSLGLLLEGSICQQAVQPVHKLLTKSSLQTQAGYSTLTRSFPLHKLLSCLQSNLELNPFGITACLRSGKKLAWAQQGIYNCLEWGFIFLPNLLTIWQQSTS